MDKFIKIFTVYTGNPMGPPADFGYPKNISKDLLETFVYWYTEDKDIAISLYPIIYREIMHCVEAFDLRHIEDWIYNFEKYKKKIK